MKTPIQILTLLVATSLLAACSPETASMVTQPRYEQPPEPVYPKVQEIKAQWITEDGGERDFEFNPQVDILFVTDNSDSMKTAQANLVANIDKFADGIVQNTLIDYHIGVISTWDSSERFATNKKDQFGIGELRFIKDRKGEYNQRFVTLKEKNLLSSTLDIGVAPLANGGPENEEFFAPLMAALDKSGNGQPNDGFFRPESQLVVIFLTDADDSNKDIPVQTVVDKLVNFKNGQKHKVSVYGALVPKDRKYDQYKDWALRVHPKYNPQCYVDATAKKPVENGKCKDGIGPDRLESLILDINSRAQLTPSEVREKFIMSIVSKSFGKDLARIGSDIKIKVLTKEIQLAHIPVVENNKLQMRVRYGLPAELAAGRGLVIPEGINGWTYNSENNSVLVAGNAKYTLKEGARFAVDLKAAIIKD